MPEKEIQQHQLFISSIRLWLKLIVQNKISRKRIWMFNKISLFVIFSAPFRWIQAIYLLFKLPSDWLIPFKVASS